MNASSEIRDLMEAEVNQITGGSREPEGGVDLPGFFLIWGQTFLPDPSDPALSSSMTNSRRGHAVFRPARLVASNQRSRT